MDVSLVIWEGNCWNMIEKMIAKNKSKKMRIEKVIKRKDDKLYVKWKMLQ